MFWPSSRMPNDPEMPADLLPPSDAAIPETALTAIAPVAVACVFAPMKASVWTVTMFRASAAPTAPPVPAAPEIARFWRPSGADARARDRRAGADRPLALELDVVEADGRADLRTALLEVERQAGGLGGRI